MALQQKSLSLRDAFAVFMLDQAARGHTQKTQHTYQHTLGQFIGWLNDAGVTRLAEVTPTHIRQYLISKRERGLAGHTIHGAARSIRAWFQLLCQRGTYRGFTHEQSQNAETAKKRYAHFQ